MNTEGADALELATDEQSADDNASGGEADDQKVDREGWAPLSRVQELVGERNRERDQRALLEEKLTWVQQQQQQQQQEQAAREPVEEAVDVGPLYDELTLAIDEGRGTDASAIQRKLDAAREADWERRLDSRLKDNSTQVSQQVSQQQGDIAFNRALKTTLVDHPELDDESATYDRATTDRVMKLMRGFHAGGDDKITAMDTAIEMVVGGKPKLGFEDRTSGQRSANAAQSKEQAPSMQSQSNRVHTETQVDVSKMTRKQFDEFKSSAGYAKLRGDEG